MFNSSKPNERSGDGRNSSNASSMSSTLIAKGVKLEGEFTSQSDVVIEGEVHGTLKTSGTLTVGTDAKILADVTVGDAMIAGTIQGNLTVANRLELKSTAKIIGDITAETVSIEGGASLSGRVSIGAKGQMPSMANGSGRSKAAAASKEI